jgi:O-antigen/teichoic acid export membrane protein
MIGKINLLRIKINKDELLRGSIILFIMIGFFNLFNYLFQISMAKLLGPSDYGVLAVLMSFLYIFGIPTEALQAIIAKYTSILNIEAKDGNGKIKDLLYRSLKKGFLISLGLFIIFIPIALISSYLLKINIFLFILAGLFIFYSLTIPIIRGVLQGKKRFLQMGWNLVLESLTKFIAGLALVFIGLNVWGAVGAFIIGGVFASFFIFGHIRDILKSKRKREVYNNVFLHNLPILISITVIVLLYSIDVIFARRFFSSETAGQYAFVSLIAKTILFSSFAIGKAMFPLSSENFEKKKNTKQIFRKAFIITALVSLVALVLFYIFPKIIIRTLSLGDLRYLPASDILFPLGIAFSLASFNYIIMLYNLSINKIKNSSWGLLLFILLEAALLVIFSHSLLAFSISLVAVNLLMFIYILIVKRKYKI